MRCIDCPEDSLTVRAAVLHEEATGHHIEDDPVPDFWDEVDTAYALLKESR